MKDGYSILNNYLVVFFNNILRIEENSLSAKDDRLTLREMHIIEAVIISKDTSMSAIASFLNITAGTLTTAVKTLEAKGYLIREKDEADKRQVTLRPTEKGILANDKHQIFHHNMVNRIIETLSAKELDLLLKGLSKLDDHFKQIDSL